LDLATGRGPCAIAIDAGRRLVGWVRIARAQQVVERTPGQRIERPESPAHQVSTSLFVPLAGHVPDVEPHIQASSGKPGNHPRRRADARGGPAGQQQAVRAEIQQPDGHGDGPDDHDSVCRGHTR